MYTMKILNDKEFDSLPVKITRGSRIDDSLGFADPATNTAYVRHTAWPELNQYLMSHELEHLLEEHKTDVDENGICHKKAWDVIKWFTPEPYAKMWTGASMAGFGMPKAGGELASSAWSPSGTQISGQQQNQDMTQMPNLGSIPNAVGQYGGTFSPQSAQTPSGMGPGAGGGNIGIMQPGLNQGGIALGAQNTLGNNAPQQPDMPASMSNYGGMSGFDNLFQSMSF